MAGYRVLSPPLVEPISLEEAKKHLRIMPDETDEDDLIASLIAASRETTENLTGRALITRSLILALDAWPPEKEIRLPEPPVQSVTAIRYIDCTGVEQTLTPDYYILDTFAEPARILPAFGMAWPVTRNQVNAVQIEYKAGYGDTAGKIPKSLLSAMKLLIGTLYEFRETVVSGTIITEVPGAVKSLINPYRVWP